MEFDQSIVHYVAVGTGLAAGLFGLFHRGYWEYDEERKVNVANGDGLAQKISKYYPKYKTVAPAVDHLAASVALTTIGGGVLGIIASAMYTNYGLPTNDSAELAGYGIVAGLYTTFELCWEAEHFLTRKTDLGDHLQVAADLAAPVAVLTTIYHALAMF